MNTDLAAKYGGAVPRYTSYPTAPHFKDAIGGATYAGWLSALSADEPVSVYLHIPFCDSLCWFCACNTSITRRKAPIARYVDALLQEIDIVARHVGTPLTADHLHFGGGSPTLLDPATFRRLTAALSEPFAFTEAAEIAIEIDPRDLEDDIGMERIRTYAEAGINRVSLGIQDFDPTVQQAINRMQSYDDTQQVVDAVRGVGIRDVNFDLMYGLPHQTADSVQRTIEQALSLRPSRVALFGYAHVPWMKRHQKMIDTTALPGPEERYRQQEVAAETIAERGYVRIGLDHFALPDDTLAQASQSGQLRRNFQGYTADQASTLIGLGASAIGSLPQGYVQNLTDARAYGEAIADGNLPVAKGVALDDDDKQRRALIEALMCDLEIRPGRFSRADAVRALIGETRTRLAPFVDDGLVVLGDDSLQVTETGRPFVRQIAAQFDRYFTTPAPDAPDAPGAKPARHSGAI